MITKITFYVNFLINRILYSTTNIIFAHNVAGFILFMLFFFQIFSGSILALSFVPEIMLISPSRETEDHDVKHIDDFWRMHERGVDYIYIAFWVHILFKFYNAKYTEEHETAWKSGMFIFIYTQFTIFFGLVLCGTHLSDVTLCIAFYAIKSFFGDLDTLTMFLLLDGTLNTDTVLRAMYCHYIFGLFTLVLIFDHTIDMHYAWTSESVLDGIKQKYYWWDETINLEMSKFKDVLILWFLIAQYFAFNVEALSYEIFMWGDVGLVEDVRYYGVAPHWYFRPFMAWLLVCPFHYMGLLGIIFFFFLLYIQPELHIHNELHIKQNILIHIKALFIWVKTLVLTRFMLTYIYGNKYRSRFFKVNLELYLIYLTYWSIKLIYLYRIVLKAVKKILKAVNNKMIELLEYLYTTKYAPNIVRAVAITMRFLRTHIRRLNTEKLNSVVFFVRILLDSFLLKITRISQFGKNNLYSANRTITLDSLEALLHYIPYTFSELTKQIIDQNKAFGFNISQLFNVNLSSFRSVLDVHTSIQWQLSFWTFVISIVYTYSMLPYGRFYQDTGGNIALLTAYLYIILYLGVTGVKDAVFFKKYF